MKLYYYCSGSSCQKKNVIKVKSNNRFDLKSEIGLEINERCKHCGNHTKRHINRLHAEPNYLSVGIGVIITLVLTAFLWQLSYLSALTGFIPIALWMGETKKASTFNKLIIRD